MNNDKILKQSHNIFWKSDSEVLSLDETNVKLSGNIKCVLSNDKRIGFESISSNQYLSNTFLKGFIADTSLSYLQNLRSFMTKFTDKDSLHYLDISRIKTTTKSFSDQLQNIYSYGCYREVNDLFNRNGLRFFAPLWVYNRLPHRFLVYRIKGTFLNIENIFENSDIVASYDLTEKSVYGKFLYSLINDVNFKKWNTSMSLEEGFKINALNPYTGNIKVIEEDSIMSFLANERTITEYDNAITNLWKLHSTICPNLLNLEFSFIDDIYDGQCTYIGIYTDIEEIDKDILEKDFLFITENLEQTKRYTPIHNDYDTSGVEKIKPSLKLVGSSTHIIDTPIEIHDPMICIDWNFTPAIDTRIHIKIDDDSVFVFDITKEYLGSTLEETMDNIAFAIEENSQVNKIGAYGEVYNFQNKSTLIIYVPLLSTFAKDINVNMSISVPEGTIVHLSKTGKIYYQPYIEQALLDNYTDSDTLQLGENQYDIIDAYQRGDGKWYIKTTATEEELANFNVLSLYKYIPIKTYLLHPVNHCQFQKDRYDLHEKDILDFDKKTYMQYLSDILIDYHNSQLVNHDYTDEELARLTIPKGTDLYSIALHDDPLETIPGVNPKDCWSPEKEIAIEITQFFNEYPDIEDKNWFEGLTSKISNPYDRLIENSLLQLKDVNKSNNHIVRWGSLFGMDSFFRPYINNISRAFGDTNFVVNPDKSRYYKSATHSWFIIGNGYGYQSNELPASGYFNSNFWDRTEITNEIKYRESALDIFSDFYKGLEQKCSFEINGEIFHYHHSWVPMELMDGYDDLYSAFFLGIEYRFQGQYNGYRFSVILISAKKFKSRKFEFIDNAYFKTLTLFIYFWLPEQLLTTVGKRSDYYLDRSILYFANKRYNGEGAIDIDTTNVPLALSFWTDNTQLQFGGQDIPKIETISRNPISREITKTERFSQFYSEQLPNSTERVPLFNVKRNDLKSELRFTQILEQGKNFSWFMLYQGIEEDTIVIKFTAINIVDIHESYFWCHDLILEFFPQGLVGDENNVPLWERIKQSFPGYDTESFYIELMRQGIPYDYELGMETSEGDYVPHVLSLKHDYYEEISLDTQIEPWFEQFVIETDPDKNKQFGVGSEKVYKFYESYVAYSNSEQFQYNYIDWYAPQTADIQKPSIEYLAGSARWLSALVTISNKRRFITFKPQNDETRAWLLNTTYDLFSHDNCWYMSNKISNSGGCFYSVDSTKSINDKFEELSFKNIFNQLKRQQIQYTKIEAKSKQEIIDGELVIVTEPYQSEYKKDLAVQELEKSIILCSLNTENNELVRKTYDEYPLRRYNIQYGPIFESISESYSKTSYRNSVIKFSEKLKYKYMPCVSNKGVEQILRIETGILNEIFTKPYFSTDGDLSAYLPYEINPVDIRNFVSVIFNYKKDFSVLGYIENSKCDICQILYQYLKPYVVTYMFQQNIDAMTNEEKYLSFVVDALDMIPDNVHTYDLHYIAFNRWFTNCFTKYWTVKEIKIDNKMYDFTQFDQNITLVNTEISGFGDIRITLK